VTAIRGLLAACLWIGAAGFAAAQTISIVTIPTGTFSHSASVAMAKVIAEQTKLRTVVQPQAQAAVVPVAAGTAEFGVGNSFDTTFYATGTGDYEGGPKHGNLRIVASMLPYRVAMHVRADSPIKTIADLKGKRVGAGFNAQKTIGRIIEAHLANAGLTYKDVEGVLTPNVSRAADDFIAGKTDVLFFAIGSAQVKQAAATVGGLRVLPIDDSPAALERMQKVLPGSYVLNMKPTPGIEGITQPTDIIAFDMVLFSNDSVADDIVYRVTKALHGGKQDMMGTFKPFAVFQPDKMAKPVKDVAFHSGALKFYREIGLAPKS
jgi:TRAP transporter TAXI family solute receptor